VNEKDPGGGGGSKIRGRKVYAKLTQRMNVGRSAQSTAKLLVYKLYNTLRKFVGIACRFSAPFSA
jgi:hypothetical protein